MGVEPTSSAWKAEVIAVIRQALVPSVYNKTSRKLSRFLFSCIVQSMGIRGELFSTRVHSQSEKRTYFFNIKENRNGDIFLNIVESKKHGDTDFERHQIVIFKEDLEAFIRAFQLATDFMKRKPSGNSSDGSGKAPTS
jgi:hypothetical protein